MEVRLALSNFSQEKSGKTICVLAWLFKFCILHVASDFLRKQCDKGLWNKLWCKISSNKLKPSLASLVPKPNPSFSVLHASHFLCATLKDWERGPEDEAKA